MTSRRHLGLILLAVLFSCAPVSAQDLPPISADTAGPPSPAVQPPTPRDVLPTVAESSDFQATSRYAEVRAFLDKLTSLTPRAVVVDIGKTHEGRDLPLVIVADPPVKSIKEATKSGKAIVLAIGNIHAGEVDAKEALLALARDIAVPENQALLKDVVLAILPIYNADGNERIARDTRPGQDGPANGQGIRENAQGLDLNRDFVKLEAPETRALVKLINDLDPHLFIDGHTTNGSYHRYPITHSIAKHPGGDARIIDFSRDKFIPAISKQIKEQAGFETFWYGNFEENQTKWADFGVGPRYSTNYVGMRNRLSLLTESYSYASYKKRVEAQVAMMRAAFDFVATNHAEIKKLIKEVDADTIKAGKLSSDDLGPEALKSIALTAKAAPWPDKVKALGFDESARDAKTGKFPTGDGQPDQPKDFEVELWTKWEAGKTTTRPYAYLLPPGARKAVELLQRHGVKVEELREERQADLEVLTVGGLSRSRPFQNHELVTVGSAEPTIETRMLAPGELIVRTSQKLGSLAAFLLEPQADDGFTAWNVFDEALNASSEFPVRRLVSATPLLTSPLPSLVEDAKPPQRLTFERLWSEGEFKDEPAPNLAGNAASGHTWLEPEQEDAPATHWLWSQDGTTWKVEAATGKAERFADSTPMREALAKLPTIGGERAKGLANGWLGRPNKARDAAIFSHDNDLYYATLDGTSARRLTATPDEELGATFSPDGRFVAFVKDFDLHVVDVETRTERALTADGTSGSGEIRNGWASWVYFEEVFGRNWQVFWWSPNSERVAFLRSDESQVPRFPMVNSIPRDQTLEQERYPKVGMPNPRVTVWVASAAGGEPVECDLSDYAPEFIVQRVGWFPDGESVFVFVTNRTQTWADMLKFPSGGGKGKKMLRLTTGAWVDELQGPEFLEDGSFVMLTDATGRRHIERFGKDGTSQGLVTSGEWDVEEFKGFIHEGGKETGVLFTGNKGSRVALNLYRTSIEPVKEGETKEIMRLTAEPGNHAVKVSTDGAMFIDAWSSVTQPTRVALRRTADGSIVRMLDTNPVRSRAEFALSEVELVTIPTPDGVELPVSLLKPTGFDATKKYPVWFMTYAGPMAPTVFDSWGRRREWDQALAEEGVVIFRADPRSALKTPRLAWTAYKQLGVPELEDIKTIIGWLKQQPWVDGERIGMSGFSYGGFITAYSMVKTDLFAAGIAGGSPTDWRDYDTIYTERYMLTPQENLENYEKTSVVKAAGDLKGRLMVLHGMMDDNVHAQNSWRLVKALQEANKPFEMMMYPEARHGVGGNHWRREEVEFIKRTLRPVRIESPSEAERTRQTGK
jgi:dipeptidyl-peptidase 4